MPTCLIALGSNLGDRRAMLEQAVERLRRDPQIELTAESRWRETRPVGGPPGQGSFLNGAVRAEASLAPQALLETLLGIENALGRRREQPWGPRTIDLDLLLYGDLVLDSPGLCLPHPRMAWRRFVLEPAAEVGGSLLHPVIGWTVAQLLQHLNTARSYLALAGPPGSGKTWLAEQLARQSAAATIVLPERDPPEQDGPGGSWGREIEFLERRTRLLEARSPRWSHAERLWVSDFWFDQSLAYAEVMLAAEERPAFLRLWEAARERVVPPRLTVLIDPRGGPRRIVAPAEYPDRSAVQGPLRARLRDALGRLASSPGRGPVLRLDDAEPEEALGSVLAALEAIE